MPYGREDRGYNGNSVCSLRYVSKFISNLNFKSIHVVDPHSDSTLAYLGENAYSFYPFMRSDIYSEIPCRNVEAVIMYPDAGAQKRYTKIDVTPINKVLSVVK